MVPEDCCKNHHGLPHSKSKCCPTHPETVHRLLKDFKPLEACHCYFYVLIFVLRMRWCGILKVKIKLQNVSIVERRELINLFWGVVILKDVPDELMEWFGMSLVVWEYWTGRSCIIWERFVNCPFLVTKINNFKLNPIHEIISLL